MVAGRLSLNQTAIRFEDDCVKFYICSEILEDFKGPFKFFLNRKRHHIKEHAIITDMLYPLTVEPEILHIENLGYNILKFPKDQFLKDIQYPLKSEFDFLNNGDHLIMSGILEGDKITVEMSPTDLLHTEYKNVEYRIELDIQYSWYPNLF